MKYVALLLAGLFVVFSLLMLNTIYPVLPLVANLANRTGETISDNWYDFLAGNNSTDFVSSEGSGQDNLDARIQTEVNRILAERFGATLDENKGLIVLPKDKLSGTSEEIASHFSDQVEVYPDSSGQSGIIVPVFRGSKGEPYIYIMTPVKQ